ncbi:hypothetical protein Tco_0090240 [Tanacetum coccineum]
MRRASKGYSGVVTPLFDTMLVQPQDETTTMPHDSPLPGGHTPGSDEGRMQHTKLMELITKLTDRIEALEKDLQQTKKTYSTAPHKNFMFHEDIETQEKNSADTEVLLKEATPTELIEDLGSGEKGKKEISIADVPISTAGAEVKLEPPKKLKKRVQVQMSIDEELARKVQEEKQEKAMAEQEQERINFEAALELQKYHALQNRPYSVAEVRKNMVMYLRIQSGSQ